jgi:hypothetical protein
MRERMSRRSFLGVVGGALAVAMTAPTLARAQSDATPPATGDLEHPTGADELVVRVALTGGFLPPQAALSEIPQFSLYGDGRVVTTGPMIMIFPPPALPNLRQMRLTEAGIQQVLAAAENAGLMDGNKTYGNNTVADAATTVFTVNAGGKTTVVAAYALGMGDDPNWTDEDRQALAKLQKFADRTMDLTAWLTAPYIASGDEEYPIERLQIVAQAIEPAQATPDPNDPAQNQTPIEWPLSTPLPEATPVTDLIGPDQNLRCGVIEGEDAAQLVKAAEQANTLTPWMSEGNAYLLTFRPLLPDESGCPPRPHEAEELPEGSPAAM